MRKRAEARPREFRATKVCETSRRRASGAAEGLERRSERLIKCIRRFLARPVNGCQRPSLSSAHARNEESVFDVPYSDGAPFEYTLVDGSGGEDAKNAAGVNGSQALNPA